MCLFLFRSHDLFYVVFLWPKFPLFLTPADEKKSATAYTSHFPLRVWMKKKSGDEIRRASSRRQAASQVVGAESRRNAI